MPEFTWLPANEATPEDVEAVFATGGARKCRCQNWKVPGWIWRDTTQEQRDVAQVEQTACGTDGPTSGLIGYVDGEPAGWVAVEPRENYPRLWARKQPWMRMDPELEGVWSVTCFVVRPGFRKAGLTYELAEATVEYGARVGARVLEGYPFEPPPGKPVIWDEASVGLLQVFTEAGYEVVASPTLRRSRVRSPRRAVFRSTRSTFASCCARCRACLSPARCWTGKRRPAATCCRRVSRQEWRRQGAC